MSKEAQQLTQRQSEAFDFIRQNAAMYGPTIREIAAAMGIRSPNGVVCHLAALERKGLIRRRPHAARGIEVLS